MNSSIPSLSESELNLKLKNLKIQNDDDIIIKICFLIIGVGALALFNALLTVLYWIDQNIPDHNVISSSNFINMMFVIITSLVLVYYNLRNFKLMLVMELILILCSLGVPTIIIIYKD